ncbi:MAG: mechanosensitive ion channel [Bacteroidetes bacterium]|jgi:small-conductance mechanosensitive channel|nr:mechanosensitive ion channel [Bacteroidota bacterium]
MDFNFDFQQFLSAENLTKALKIAIIIIVGYGLIQLLALIVRRFFTRKMSPQGRMLLNKAIVYTGVILLVFAVLREFGINITTLLAGAGIVGVIVGFASQTSVGNIISGLFVISEKSFEIGDLIRVGDKLGIVYSVDLLSTKLRTLDNLLIRIPNQNILSTDITNITKFPIRRMDVKLSVAYKEDLRKVKEVLQDVAVKNPLVLDEPETLILFQNYGASGIDITFGVWFEKTNYVKLRNSLFIDIQEAFERAEIEIPFPHVSLYRGEASKPFQVEVINEAGLS